MKNEKNLQQFRHTNQLTQLQSEIDAEETARQNADTTLQSNVDKKANIEDVYTKAQSDAKYLTQHQDISNLITKTELQEELKIIDCGVY